MLALDANIFLEVLLEQEKCKECSILLDRIRKGEATAKISGFTISGITLIMSRYRKKGEDIRRFLISIYAYKGLSIYLPKLSDQIEATRIMNEYDLDFEDAMTLQCAIASGAKEFVTLDTDFKGVKNIKILSPLEIQ